jgi:protein TonB
MLRIEFIGRSGVFLVAHFLGTLLAGCTPFGQTTTSRGNAARYVEDGRSTPYKFDLITARPDEIQQPDEFLSVDKMPAPIGGMAAIRSRIQYPDRMRDSGVQGNVQLQFVITEKGTLQDLVILKSLHPELDQIALDAVAEIRFTPGEIDGEPVRVLVSLPIPFDPR